ncbi:deoxyribonuclease IV [Desulfococcus sp.]|uniref:deoxyribonuclease IV n=1 Tax=Desulfococcus sp. TaxID=2025834 RepID=UPI003593D18D
MASDPNGRPPLLLGAHFSIAGGLHNALYSAAEYGCGALQIFTRNSRTWKETPLIEAAVARFDQARRETGITEIAAHTSYLINIATPDEKNRTRSRDALAAELERCARLGIPYVVHHPGAHLGAGTGQGIATAAREIRGILEALPGTACRLLIETTAGQGTGIGRTFEEIALILAAVDAPERTGVCLDTCHIFAAGYDIRTREAYDRTLAHFERTIGLDSLFVLHLNDAKTDLGSRVDRHAHIGEGAIGLDAFGFFMQDPRLARCPKIIETPKMRGKTDMDRVNLDRLRGLAEGRTAM